CEGPTGGAVSNEEVPLGPLRFQGTISRVALGDIRIKPMRESRVPEGDWKDFAEKPAVGGSFEVQARLSLSDRGASQIRFSGADPGDEGFRVVLNHTGPGPDRTGSILPGRGLTTQHPFPGVPFDLRLVREYADGQDRVRVWLNDVLVNDVKHTGASQAGLLEWIPVDVPGTEVQVERMLMRTL
ncbi:MAG: hypothetical protein KDB61_04975, partial [Planctomycetes bacterium]|nr:hypothetical protein [Planctomycetota bacterium]